MPFVLRGRAVERLGQRPVQRGLWWLLGLLPMLRGREGESVVLLLLLLCLWGCLMGLLPWGVMLLPLLLLLQ